MPMKPITRVQKFVYFDIDLLKNRIRDNERKYTFLCTITREDTWAMTEEERTIARDYWLNQYASGRIRYEAQENAKLERLKNEAAGLLASISMDKRTLKEMQRNG